MQLQANARVLVLPSCPCAMSSSKLTGKQAATHARLAKSNVRASRVRNRTIRLAATVRGSALNADGERQQLVKSTFHLQRGGEQSPKTGNRSPCRCYQAVQV